MSFFLCGRGKRMKEIQMNREIRNYRESVMFGLPLRQFVFFSAGAAAAVVCWFLLKERAGTEVRSWLCMLASAPFILAGTIRYNGMSTGQLIKKWAELRILTPRVLTYKAENLMYALARDTIEKEIKDNMEENGDEAWRYHEKRK